jgi:hypothetical protein
MAPCFAREPARARRTGIRLKNLKKSRALVPSRGGKRASLRSVARTACSSREKVLDIAARTVRDVSRETSVAALLFYFSNDSDGVGEEFHPIHSVFPPSALPQSSHQGLTPDISHLPPLNSSQEFFARSPVLAAVWAFGQNAAERGGRLWRVRVPGTCF